MPTIVLHKPKPRVVTYNKSQYQYIYQDKRWRLLRATKIANNPLCEICLANGRVTIADEVHHIKPFEISVGQVELEERAFDYNNLMSLCTGCHKKIHVQLSQKL